MKVTVRYWIGTTQYTGTATTYRGALRIASRNRNACLPTYWDEQGRQLIDDGQGLLIYHPETSDEQSCYVV